VVPVQPSADPALADATAAADAGTLSDAGAADDVAGAATGAGDAADPAPPVAVGTASVPTATVPAAAPPPAESEVVRATASVSPASVGIASVNPASVGMASVGPILDAERPEFLPGIAVPVPDDAAILAAWERLSSIDIGVNAPTISGLGTLAEPVAFMAGVQAHPYPRPILSTRVVLVTGNHAGGLVAGSAPDARNSIPLQQLADAAGASFVTLEWNPAANAIELEDAITGKQLDAAMRMGWAEAERAADEGIELLVLAAGGAGSSAAAVAVISAITGYETSALLGRVVTPAGVYDDNAWMTRALALRDAMYRVRHRDGDPRTVLCALGGADIAGATGLLLGAASRRLPVMIDGPVGAAAALLANDFAPSARRWFLLPDHGRNVAVIVVAEALELKPWMDLCLDLGEGATSLAALPLLQMALKLAGAGVPVEPQPLTRFDPTTGAQVFVGHARVEEAEEPVEEEPVEPEPPSPALTAPTTSIGAKAKSRPAPPKPTPTKAAGPRAAKAAATKARGGRSGGTRSGATKSTRAGAKATAEKATTAKATAEKAPTAKATAAKSAPKAATKPAAKVDDEPVPVGGGQPESTAEVAPVSPAPAAAVTPDAGPVPTPDGETGDATIAPRPRKRP
jgi:NaMN:DMB phosphoribosyltransferase